MRKRFKDLKDVFQNHGLVTLLPCQEESQHCSKSELSTNQNWEGSEQKGKCQDKSKEF